MLLALRSGIPPGSAQGPSGMGDQTQVGSVQGRCPPLCCAVINYLSFVGLASLVVLRGSQGGFSRQYSAS